jgi:hypothetical protein
LLEVKATNGSARTPFFLTRNECHLAMERPAEWRIYRVHLFAKEPRIFTIAPPLENVRRHSVHPFPPHPGAEADAGERDGWSGCQHNGRYELGQKRTGSPENVVSNHLSESQVIDSAGVRILDSLKLAPLGG